MHDTYFPAMRAVSERIARAPHVLLGIDFDGTLTPIVDDPTQAQLDPPLRELLQTLAGRDRAALMLLSGRTYADLQDRVGIAGAIYAANHGLEIHGPSFSFVEPSARECRPLLQELAPKFVQRLHSVPGVLVEDKGLTLSVHYRHVPASDREQVWRTVHDAVAGVQNTLVLTTGNKVYEIRPHVLWNKGLALNWTRRQLGRDSLLVYLGSAETPEEVFITLQDAITIKIGDSADSAARFVLSGPAEAQRFLEWVEELLREGSAASV